MILEDMSADRVVKDTPGIHKSQKVHIHFDTKLFSVEISEKIKGDEKLDNNSVSE